MAAGIAHELRNPLMAMKILIQAAAERSPAVLEGHDLSVLEEEIKKYCETQQIKIGDMNHILRVATTGVTVGPGVFECLAILGREETLRRIDLALKLLGG